MKTLSIIVLAILLLGVVGGFVYLNMNKSNGTISGQTVNTITPTDSGNTQPNNANTNTNNGNVREIKVDAKRFEFTPSTITIKKGEKVRFIINNIDTTHGMKFPDFGVAGNDVVELSVDKSGTYKWYCNSYCGEGHNAMSGTLVVTD